jgi:hypothetical protein
VRIRPLACAAVLCLGAVALDGCGSAGHHAGSANSGSIGNTGAGAATPAAQAPKLHVQRGDRTPVESNPDVHATRTRSHHALGSGKVTVAGSTRRATGIDHVGPTKSQRARATPYTTSDDQSSTAAVALNPCTLVSLSQAQALTGGAVTSRIVAPLGPTCIFHQSRSRTNITLALVTESAAVARHLSRRSTLRVGGRQAYCGTLGSTVLLLPLSRNQLLNVTAPCAVAQRFAALALSRLSA